MLPMLDAGSVSPDAPPLGGLLLALAIGLLLGFERGWHLRGEGQGQRVAGIRTFAMLGLLGGLCGMASVGPGWPLAALIVAGAVGTLLLGYWTNMQIDRNVSATSALAAILCIGLGALATMGNMAAASVGAGAATILLASRERIHKAIDQVTEEDIRALVRLVLVVLVVFPLLPDRDMGPYSSLNPQRLWIVVVVTVAISFAGYALVRWVGERRGALLAAALGSLVSSTAVTVECARQARDGQSEKSVSAAIVIASSTMLLRSLFLVAVIAPFAFTAFLRLVAPGLAVSLVATAILFALGRHDALAQPNAVPRAPDLKLALVFAASVAMLSLGSAAAQAMWGGDSRAILIAIGGVADIDASIAAVGTLPRGTLTVPVAALTLAVPTLLNTIFKLMLFIAISGWRAKLGGLSLAAVAVALAASVGSQFASLP